MSSVLDKGVRLVILARRRQRALFARKTAPKTMRQSAQVSPRTKRAFCKEFHYDNIHA